MVCLYNKQPPVSYYWDVCWDEPECAKINYLNIILAMQSLAIVIFMLYVSHLLTIIDVVQECLIVQYIRVLYSFCHVLLFSARF